MIDIFEKLAQLKFVPFVKNNLESIVASAAVVEIKDAFFVGFNKSQPLSVRILSSAKGGCCTVALISAYTSKIVPNQRVASAFRICSYTSTLGYSMLGGNVPTTVVLSSLLSDRWSSSKA